MMIPRVMLSLAAAAAVSARATGDTPIPAAKAGRAILRRCGPIGTSLATVPDTDWTPIASAEAKHTALRRSLDEPMPTAGSIVSIHAVGGDLATTEFSVMLARAADGRWNGTAVGQSTIWIKGAKPSITPRKEWTLSAADGRRLDALLADRCFYAEPTYFHHDRVPAVGVLHFTFETRTPGHRRRVAYDGGAVEGLTRQVTELTFPPGG